MNRSKKYMMVAALATLSCGAMAQGPNTGYFIDGYTFRHNLNPAYGNDQNYVSIPALGNIQVRTQAISASATYSSTTRAMASTATRRRPPS